MEKVLTIAVFIVLGLLLALSVAVILGMRFAKEKHRKIYIVHKRETLYPNRRYYGGSGQKFTTHYTVDCRYSDSDKIHTLDCPRAVFDSLKEGRSYVASVKMLHIVAISKK